MDGFQRFAKKELHAKEEFFLKLAGKGITDEEYTHAKKVWAKFGCKTLGDYCDLYVKTDIVLLADAFENFQKVCIGKVRARSSTLLHSPQSELGRAAEKDRHRAGAFD